MTDKKTRVILIRHGESNVTVQRILGGEKSCTGLSELGQQQATALRDRLAAVALATVGLVLPPPERGSETDACDL